MRSQCALSPALSPTAPLRLTLLSLAGPGPCSPHANCTNLIDTYSCVCGTGWTGDGWECGDIDECADGSPVQCPPGLACSNLVNMQQAEGLHGAQDGRTVSAVLEVFEHAMDATDAL